ncbi:hypothetical protein S83_065643 [Arachis hypogaea]
MAPLILALPLNYYKACADAVVQKSIQATMEEALVRILTLRCSIDILRDVHAAKEQRKLYVAEFFGINGVGESTNLDKVKRMKETLYYSLVLQYLITPSLLPSFIYVFSWCMD